jgi:hypothetical protein
MVSTNLARAASRQVARPLSAIAPLAKAAIERGHNASSLHYRTAGELLLEAKAQETPPAFEKWIKKTFTDAFGKPLSLAAAKTWMEFAKVKDDVEAPFVSLSDFKRRHLKQTVVSGSKRMRLPPDVKKVFQSVDAGALRRAAMSQAQEIEIQRTLSLKLIDIGYKTLAMKFHTDHGGEHEAMARLNNVRDNLNRHVEKR